MDTAGTVRRMTRWAPVQWFRDHPALADALLAGALGVFAIIGLFTIDPDLSEASNRDPDALAVLLVLALSALLAVRRRWPIPVLWLGAAATVTYWVRDYVDAGVSMVVLILLYTVAAHCERRHALPHVLGVTTILLGVMIVGVFADEEDLPAVAVLANVVIFLTALVLGDSMRNRRAYLAEVEARAERAEAARETAALRAVQEERTRIARDLHDVVAHSVSVMVIQAGAARRVLDRHPEQAAESLGIIERTGRDALDELRRVLGVLRSSDGDASTAPQPTADDLESLVRHWREAGLPVELHVDGAPFDLSAGVGLTVYRVVQEALTNVMKHAGPASATVHVRYRPDTVSIVVTDDGRGPRAHDDPIPSAQQGLIGMRERVELFGGSLTVGPRPGGGFQVRAALPVPSAVPAGQAAT